MEEERRRQRQKRKSEEFPRKRLKSLKGENENPKLTGTVRTWCQFVSHYVNSDL
jgi:hypothetical protein